MPIRREVLSDHRREGKKFYPPGARAFWKEVHYIERIIPEIAWISYFLSSLGTDAGMACALSYIEVCHRSRHPENLELTLCSNYRQLREVDWDWIRKRLKSKDIFLQCLDALTPFIRCFPTANTMLGLVEDLGPNGPSETDIKTTRQIVTDLFDRRSKMASIVQSAVFKAGLSLGTHHVPQDYPFSDFKVLVEDFDSDVGRSTAAHVRMHLNAVYGHWETRMGDSWARYFWNRGRDFARFDADNHRDLPVEKRTLHPAMQLGLDFEQYAWTVVDHIWERLPVDIYESEVFEVIGALLARQCNLAVKLFKNIELWDYHAGPLILRPMTDCFITAAWILKDPLDRARKFISYGLGQEKLAIERLKLAVEQTQGNEREELQEGITARESWVNGQHYTFLQIVDVGSWSGISTRKMAEEADCSGLYDFAYTGWSHAAHGMWNHIGKYDVWPSLEPLHKHILQPANIEHGFHIDVIDNATKYFDELCVLLVKHFELQMTIPQPSEWLTSRLEQFYAEMDQREATQADQAT